MIDTQGIFTVILGFASLCLVIFGWMINAKNTRDQRNREGIWKRIDEIQRDYSTTPEMHIFVEMSQRPIMDRLDRLGVDIQEINAKL